MGFSESLVLLRSFILFCFVLSIMAFFLLEAGGSEAMSHKKAIKFRAVGNMSILLSSHPVCFGEVSLWESCNLLFFFFFFPLPSN